METSEWRFHVVCHYEMVGEYEDSDGILTRVYRCALCGRPMERKSVFGRVAKDLEGSRRTPSSPCSEGPSAGSSARSWRTSSPT